MYILFYLFYSQALRFWGTYVITTTFAYLVLSHFGCDPLSLRASVFVCGFLYITFQFSQFVPANLTWIMALPISKRKILIFNYFFSLLLIATFFVSFFLFVVTSDFLKTGGFHYYNELTANQNGHLPPSQLWLWFQRHPILVCSIFSIIHGACMVRLDPVSARLRRLNLWYALSRRKRAIAAGTGVGLGCLLIIFSKFYFSGFFFFVLACTFFVIVPAFTSATAISMSRPSFRRLLIFSIALAALQIGIVYRISINNARDVTNPQRIFSIVFLGPFGQDISRENIAQLLETDLGETDFNDLATDYLFHFNRERRVFKNEDPFLHFDKVVNSKSNLRALLNILRLYDPSTLELDDLVTLFTKWIALNPHPVNFYYLAQLLPARLSNGDLRKLLEIPNENARSFALLKMRYQRSNTFIPLIEKSILDLSDPLRLTALKTLSLLYGRSIGLDDWVLLKSRRSLGGSEAFATVDCNTFNITSIQDIRPETLPILSICLHERIDIKDQFAIQELESGLFTWSLPLDASQDRIVKDAFKIK